MAAVCVCVCADKPPYEPLRLEGIASGRFKYGGYFERDNCSLHLQDVAENAGDTAHFGMVHGKLNTPILTNFFYVSDAACDRSLDRWIDGWVAHL
jgi:hypothetical protein